MSYVFHSTYNHGSFIFPPAKPVFPKPGQTYPPGKEQSQSLWSSPPEILSKFLFHKYFVFQRKAVPLQAEYYQIVLRV